MKHLCILLLVTCSHLSGHAQKKPAPPQLHVLYVMEQEDPQYGLLNLKNEERISQVMETIKWGLGYTMVTTYLTKKEFTSTALKKAITTFKTGPKDVIVLYYAGFGLVPAEPKNKFANWKLHDRVEQGLSVNDVETWLVAKKVHLCLLVAECSAQRMVEEESNLTPPQSTLNKNPDLRAGVIRRLFLDNCGIVKMGSSLPSRPSWGDARFYQSIFTGAFVDAFGSLLMPSASATLPKVTFPYLNQLIEESMSAGFYERPYKQIPVLEIKPCKGPAQTVVERTAPDTLATESLNGLLNALAMNKDEIQRARLIRQLLGYFTKDAMIDVDRYYKSPQGLQSVDQDTSRYQLNDYLTKVHIRVKMDEGQVPPERVARLKLIAVVEKSRDNLLHQQISYLRLREEWIQY